MNHLKHIRGISARASSNAALPLHYGQHADAYFENRQLRPQLLRSTSVSVGKKNHDVKLNSGQFRQDSLRLVSKESKTICKQRSKTKLSVTSLKKKSSMQKKLPSESVVKRVCHYSTWRDAKFGSDGINKGLVAQGVARMNGARIVNRHSSFIASVEKHHPRSYAEMIADYSNFLYKESAAQNDSFNNAVRRSPFSTLSTSPPAKKMMNVVAEHGELTTEKNDFSLPVKPFDLCNRGSNLNAVERYDFQHHGARTADVVNKSIDQSCVTTNDLKSDDRSYAKLIADCSKSMCNITSVLNDGPVPRNALARNSFESITTPREDSSTCTRKKLREITPAVSTMPVEENMEGQVIDLKTSDLFRKMENVMNDMKSATERKVAKVVPKMKESDSLPVNAPDLSDGINEFTELGSVKKNDAAIRRLSYRYNKIDRLDKRKKDFELQKHNYSHSSDRSSNLPRYSAAESSTRKSSTHVTTSGGGVGGVSRQPQVKLRMVPSEKESIVSIDVDQTPVVGSSDPLSSTSKHLSVVVQSDRKEDLQLTDNQWNAPALRRTAKSALQRGDFGPMRISISEDSAPVKQIEFSINGKPVSELKSVTARAEKLDVVSSPDKIEIRIPFPAGGDDTSAWDKIREGDLSKGTNKGQILNVQISANFQDESATGSSVETPTEATRYQYGEDRIPKSSISKNPYFSNNLPKAREETLRSDNTQQYEPPERADVKLNDVKNIISKHSVSDDFKIQRKETKNSQTDIRKTENFSLIREVNNVEAGRLIARKVNTGFPEGNKYNKDESDDRVPSKIIPWWSSSDAYNKIRKKDDDRKPFGPPSNRNNRKTASSLNKNVIAESLLAKPKEMSNSKIPTKKTQSTNNSTTVTTSDSSNTISYSNSMKPYEESKSIPRHVCSFRLKPNQGNLVPEITSNGLKAEDNQALTANKDVNKISGVKQTKSYILFEPDTMSIKGKHDISAKEKTFVLERKIRIPNSAQNLSPKKNEEKKNNYSLKQTRSIDDVSKNINSKINNILDVVKPIEKRAGGTSMEYDLKGEMLSRKPTVISNSGMKEVQNPSPVIITTKALISKSPMREIVSNKINKNMLTKQIETKEKLKTNIDISMKEGKLKNNPINIKALNNADVKNMKKVHKDDFMNSNFSYFSNSPELLNSQTLKKQERLSDSVGFQDKSKQNLKSLEADKSGSNSLLNMKISSGTVQRLKNLGKISLDEPKQNKQKSLTSVKNTPGTLQEFEKLKGLALSKLANPFKEFSDTIMINKLSLQTVKQIQSKNVNKITNISKSSLQTASNLTSKIKAHVGTKNLIDKNISETSFTQYSVKTENTNIEEPIARIVTQNPKNKDFFSKGYEKNFNKSGLDKGNLFGSGGPSRKPSNSVGFKSASSKIKSRVMLNNNYTYDRKLHMESFCSNFNRKNDIMPNSQSAIFKDEQNLSDVNMLEHPVPSAVGCDGLWINMDRPEKSLLYSAWLQRSDNEVKKNGKLF